MQGPGKVVKATLRIYFPVCALVMWVQRECGCLAVILWYGGDIVIWHELLVRKVTMLMLQYMWQRVFCNECLWMCACWVHSHVMSSNMDCAIGQLTNDKKCSMRRRMWRSSEWL